MTLEAFLGRLEGVILRGSRHVALCPAHADRSPSLQVSPGDSGLLVKCWAGCTTAEVCGSLGLRLADLFYDAGLPRDIRPIRPVPRVNHAALAFQFELSAFDRRTRAGAVLNRLSDLDLAPVSDDDLDRLLSTAASAYEDLDLAHLHEQLADELRGRA
ncbi:hypothetical protein W02_38330 [Nitrospira sp. KM1]|uniref:hypothetical protein n=1 Tax=Nitrospira sp. KM1 TaxID=1936990 RepID=UPI0013A7439B|nr:hypothetical protein [Nitrospira sp. KM1]BCA56693.1 hypothetical protein W02_38330 [Nitrospira sp. KM1]